MADCCPPKHEVDAIMDNSTNEHLNKKQSKKCKNTVQNIFLPEINKVTLHYYGSIDEILKEIIRTKNPGCFIIHPHSLFRRQWLWIMILVTSINMLAVPLDVSFFGKHMYIGWTVYNVFVDALFIVDLSLNFRMGYHKNMQTVLDLGRIRNNYLKTWFMVDLLAVTPFEYLILISMISGTFDPNETKHLMKIKNVLKLLRLLRVLRLVRYIKDLMERLNVGMKSTLELTYTIFGIFLICHWNACFQFMLVMLMDYPPNSWVTLEGLEVKPIHTQYTKAMFHSLCHMMTLNYGSGIPKGVSEQWMMITSITVGTVLYALVLAKITALHATFNTSQRAYKDKHNELKVFIRERQVPGELRPRVFDHMENCYQGKWFDEKAILDELSEPLKLAVMQNICGDLLSNAFGDTDPLFVAELLLVVEFESYQMGDVIIWPGTVAEYMYFIDKGTVVVENAGVKHTLMDGDFFGEKAMEKFSKHHIKASAVRPCRLCCLSVDTYHAVLEGFPELKGKRLIRASLPTL